MLKYGVSFQFQLQKELQLQLGIVSSFRLYSEEFPADSICLLTVMMQTLCNC